MYYATDKRDSLKQKRERQRQAVERRLAVASKTKKQERRNNKEGAN